MEDRGQEQTTREMEEGQGTAGRTGHRMRPWEALLTQKQAQRLRDTRACGPFRSHGGFRVAAVGGGIGSGGQEGCWAPRCARVLRVLLSCSP